MQIRRPPLRARAGEWNMAPDHRNFEQGRARPIKQVGGA
jgi:hypothetical protein